MYFEEAEENRTYFSNAPKIITGTEIDLVAQISGLDLPGFLDSEQAKRWGFKDRVTPGPYVIACVFALMSRQGFLSDAVWTSAEEISFKTPVLPLDRLSAECQVIGKQRSERGGGFVTYRWKVRNQREELVASGTNT